MSTISFYNTSIKKDDLVRPPSSASKSESGNIINPLDDVNPKVYYVGDDAINYNLIKISDFNKYYFIESVEYTGYRNECILHCHSAVLLNNYNDIVNTEFKVTLSCDNFESDLDSYEVPTLAKKSRTSLKFKSLPISDSYVLCVLGGS